MTCLHCHREFTPRQWNHKFCSKQCADFYREHIKPKLEVIDRINFERDWAQWKKDFAEGKTESNLRSGCHEH